jgi:HK97 family phage major capsid protein
MSHISKQIAALMKKRNAHLDAMSTLSELATTGEGRSFTEDETTAFDKDALEVTDIDKQLERLLAAEKQMASRAEPAPSPLNPTRGLEVPAFKAFPGQAMTRYIATLARSKGNLPQALELSKRFDETTPEVGTVIRAAVAAGTTQDPAWASPLVQYTVMATEFINFLRPQTILGKIVGTRPVPFMTRIPRQIAGASAQWVGEQQSKPVGVLAFDLIQIPFAKMAVICVITEELARLSTPSAELLVRDDLIAAIAQYSDQQFINRTIAPLANVRPGSVTNANANAPSSGNSVAHVTADLSAALLNYSTANIIMTNPVWVMHNVAYQFLLTQRSSIDTFVWKDEMISGKLMGIPYVVSNNVPLAAGLSDIVLLDASEILVADDNQILIDTSSEASLQMDSAPGTPPTPLVSLWQQNMLGVKAERYIYWLLRRAAASYSITGFPAAAP